MNGGLYYWAAAGTTSARRHLPPRHGEARPAGRAVHDDGADRGPLRRVSRAVARRHEDGDHLRRRQRQRQRSIDVATSARSPTSNDVELRDVHARRLAVPHASTTACSPCATTPTQAVIATMPSAGLGLASRPVARRHAARLRARPERRRTARRLELRRRPDLHAHVRSRRRTTFGAETAARRRRQQQLLPVVLARRPVDPVQPVRTTTRPTARTTTAAPRCGWSRPTAARRRSSSRPRTRRSASPTRGARWAPFAQTVGANAEPIYWITVSSKRDFGVRLVGLRAAADLDDAVLPATARPPPRIRAPPAFRLPFQNIDSNNHIAQWTEQRRHDAVTARQL